MENHKDLFWTIPNVLTFSRFILIGFIMWVGLNDQWGMVLLLGAIASLTDFFDGKIARSTNVMSKIGATLDPIADKGLVIVIVCLVNIYLGIIVLVLEASGAYFSNSARGKGGHLIAHGSKGITFFQMLFMLILVFNRIEPVSYFSGFEHELYGIMLALSLTRLLMYSSINKAKQKEKKERSELESKTNIAA